MVYRAVQNIYMGGYIFLNLFCDVFNLQQFGQGNILSEEKQVN